MDAPNRVTGRATKQAIFGASDLDVMPAGNAHAVVGRLTADRGTTIAVTLRPDRRGWGSGSAVRVVVTNPAGQTVIDHRCTGAETTVQAQAGAVGEHLIALTGQQLPENGSPFEIEVTYTAPQTV